MDAVLYRSKWFRTLFFVLLVLGLLGGESYVLFFLPYLILLNGIFRLKAWSIQETLLIVFTFVVFGPYILSTAIGGPSCGDSSNHLFFLESVYDQKKFLSTHFTYQYEGLPLVRYFYYPTGSHVIFNLFTQAYRDWGWLPNPQEQLRLSFLVLMGLLSLWTYRFILKIASTYTNLASIKSIKWLSFALTALLINLNPFPIGAFAEGGFSRIFGYTLILSLGTYQWSGFFYWAVIIPVLFWIHPSTLIIFSPLYLHYLLSHKKTNLSLWFLKPIIGLIACYLLLKTNHSGADHNPLFNDSLKPIYLSFNEILQSIKGVFHYQFAHFAFPLKFFSISSVLIIAALIIKRPENSSLKLLGMMLLGFPYFLEISAHIPYLQIFASFFYYQTKRISELHFLSTLVLYSLATGILIRSRIYLGATMVMIGMTLFLSYPKIKKTLETTIYQEFQSLKKTDSYTLNELKVPDSELFPKRVVYQNGCSQALYHFNPHQRPSEEIPAFSLCVDELSNTPFCKELSNYLNSNRLIHRSFINNKVKVALEP